MTYTHTFGHNSVCLMNEVAESLIKAGYVNVHVEPYEYKGFKLYDLNATQAPRLSRKERGL